MEQLRKHYYAFISHSSKDEKMAKWLLKQLENYHIPATIQKEYHAPKRLKPIFLFQKDLTGNKLRDALEGELRDSKFLIVVCSPASARSEYVNAEVQHFIDSGRYDKIIPFIIDGVPFASLSGQADEECFPPALISLKGTDRELRGIDLRESIKQRGSRQAAVVDIVASMLGVRFDVLWDRYKRKLKKVFLFAVIISMLALEILYIFAIPTSISITLVDENHNLPKSENAELFINNIRYQLNNLDTTISYMLPGYEKIKTIQIKFKGMYYFPISEAYSLKHRAKLHHRLILRRDSTFQIFSGYVLSQNGEPVENAHIFIENQHALSNKNGFFKMTFPVEKQSISKRITITKKDFCTIEREEIPSNDATFILFQQ